MTELIWKDAQCWFLCFFKKKSHFMWEGVTFSQDILTLMREDAHRGLPSHEM